MKENWPYIFLVGVLSLAFIIFLIRQNRKDQKQLEKKLNEDYHKKKDEENDVDTEDTPKIATNQYQDWALTCISK